MACSSAAGGLKMVAIGLVKNLTAEAAKRAALGPVPGVMKVFAHELSSLEVQEIDPSTGYCPVSRGYGWR